MFRFQEIRLLKHVSISGDEKEMRPSRPVGINLFQHFVRSLKHWLFFFFFFFLLLFFFFVSILVTMVSERLSTGYFIWMDIFAYSAPKVNHTLTNEV